MAVAALDTTSGGGSLQAHSHVLWNEPQKCSLRAGGADQPRREEPHGDRDPADRAWRPQCAAADHAPVGAIPCPVSVSRGDELDLTFFTQDGSGQHVIVVSGTQAGWIRAGKLVLLRAPGSALESFLGISIAW